jgi:2-methylcitrate dehydratase PrpD
MEFAMASALTVGRAGLSELTDGFVRRPDVQAAMSKVSIATTDTVAEDDPVFAAFDRVELKLADGKALASPDVQYARGHWALPLTREDLWAKFRDCAGTTLQENGAQALFEGLQTLERHGNLRELGAI